MAIAESLAFKTVAQPTTSVASSPTSFHSPLASVLFHTQAPFSRIGVERRAVKRFKDWFDACATMSDVRMSAHLRRLNGRVLPKLSGAQVLLILQHVEYTRPRLLPAMAIAVIWQERLRQAQVYSEILNPQSLQRLAQALSMEAELYA